jgi:hypothetical protein
MKNNTFKIRTNTINLAQVVYKYREVLCQKDNKFWEDIQNIMAEIYCIMEMINYPNINQRQYDQIHSLVENIFKLKYRVLMLNETLWETADEILKHIDWLSKVLSLVLDISKDWEKIKIV